MASDTLRLNLLASPRLSDRIDDESREPSSGFRVLDFVGMPFYALGLITFWMLAITGGVTRWCAAGVRLGWLEARRSAQGRGWDGQRWPVRPKGGRKS